MGGREGAVPVQKTNVLPALNDPKSERLPHCPELDAQLLIDLGIRGRVSDGLRREIWDECRRDAAFYIFNFCRTFDPKNELEPVRPFPKLQYLYDALEHFLLPDSIVAMVKSRQMTVSWLVCAILTWVARFNEHRHCPIQCKNEEDASEFVFNHDWFAARCAFIEYAMSPLLWHPEGPIVGKKGRLNYPKGSWIRAMTKGKHIFRSGAFSFGVIDEAAFCADFDETYTGALAATKGGGKLRLLSTAKYGTEFGLLVEAQERLVA